MRSLTDSTRLSTTRAEWWAPYETRFGTGWIGWSGGDDVVALALPGSGAPGDVSSAPVAVQALARRLRAYFDGSGRLPEADSLNERCGGTRLDVEIRRVVAHIRRGDTMTYAEVAAAVGRPGAARAVGSAMARNPIAPIVPCHRVIGSDGGLRGYGGGLAMKQALLEMEQTDA